MKPPLPPEARTEVPEAAQAALEATAVEVVEQVELFIILHIL